MHFALREKPLFFLKALVYDQANPQTLFVMFCLIELCLSGVMQPFHVQDDQEESLLSTVCSGEKVLSVQVLRFMKDEPVTELQALGNCQVL